MRPVIIYLDDAPRRSGGSGAHLRFFSNVRGWCDTGAPVHLVRFVALQDGPWSGDPDLPLKSVSEYRVAATGGATPSVAARVAFRLAIPTRSALRMYHPHIDAAIGAIADMTRRYPGALHVIEGEWLAAAALHRRVPWIWSEHEAPTENVAASHAALNLDERDRGGLALRREQRFVAAIQRRIERRAAGIMYIRERPLVACRAVGGGRPRAYVPLSLGGDDVLWSRPSEDHGRPLRLLHLGGVTHLPTYSSLRFLLREVFPLLSPAVIERMHLSVVGRFYADNPRCREIAELASPYRNVHFSGFASSLEAVYGSHDAQILATVEGAGLRTRVVETFARGLPLVATDIAVGGMPGVQPNRHYLSLGTAAQAAERLQQLVKERSALAQFAAAGRALYETAYSRSAVRDAIVRAFGPLYASE